MSFFLNKSSLKPVTTMSEIEKLIKIKNILSKYYRVILFQILLSVFIIPAQSQPAESSELKNPMNITFKNIQDQKIKDCFMEVFNRYETLHQYDITLVQKRIKSSTMQAQPIFSLKSLFTGVKRYQIKLALYVKDSDQILVSDLPDEVLTGWFAHELGHVVDYEPRSNFGMVMYGFRYVFSDKFKRQAEHTADNIAVINGFAAEIIATKRYILENDFLGDRYKSIINKYYMSIDDVGVCEDENVPVEPKIEL